MKYEPFLLEPVNPARTKVMADMRQKFKQRRMRQTGVGIFWTPELAAKEGALQIEAAKWQTDRRYSDRDKLIAPSRLNNARDNYAQKPLAISMRGAETWLLVKDKTRYIFKQDPRLDSYQYEKEALQRIRDMYSDREGRHFPLMLGYDDAQQILITSYLAGKTLADIDPGDLTARQKVDFLRQILHCLRLLHRIGIAHFDLAPRKFKLLPHGLGLIDFGSCGLGETIESVEIGHLRNTKNPEGPRFHRAPELTHCTNINGLLAERYGIARLAYWLHFGTVEPLIAAAAETGYMVDPHVLTRETVTLNGYSRAKDKELLQLLATNFNPEPHERIVSENQLLDSFGQRYGY